MYENIGALLHGRDGYLWIGMDGGVARFDGVKFVMHRMGATTGLVGDTVRCLLQDSSGALWIGSNRGLSRYRDGKFETIIETNVTSYVYSMCEDKDKTIWIGTQTGLMQYRNNALVPAFTDPHVAGKSILALFSDSKGRVWIGILDYTGVICYENGTFKAIEPGPVLSNQIMAVAETPAGILWFGTGANGLVRYDTNTGVFTTYGAEYGLSGKTVTALLADPSGSLWIGALGLHRLDSETGKIENLLPLVVPSIRKIDWDTEGSIWAASYGDGVMRVRPARYKILNSEGGLPGDFVRTISQDSTGAMWLSQSGQGAVRIAPDGTITRIDVHDSESKGDDVLSVCHTRSGVTIVCSQRALYIMNGDEIERYPEYRGTRSSQEDSHGAVWLGCFERGALIWKDGKLTQLNLPPAVSKSTACAFLEGPDGTMYIATTTQGVLAVRGSDVTWFNKTNALPSDEARALYIDHDKNLWVGTKRGLAIRIGNQWYAPSWLREVVDEHVSGIAEIPNDYLLICTTHGVVRFPRRALLDAVKSPEAPKYLPQVTIAEGARTGSIGAACHPAVWTTTTGEVWIAARKGAVVIDPKRIAIDTVVPPVRIEELKADGKEFEHASATTLAAGTKQLTIEYSAVTFVQTNRVLFKYRLEGYEDENVDAGTRRTAFYNNLPPGRYVFHVTACNSDGVWNPVGAQVTFVVLPFFYQTWWFRVLVALGAIGAIALIIRWRVRRIQRHAQQLQEQNAELERRIAERTAELAKSLEALKASEYFYHSLVESLPQAIVRKDANSRFTYANSGFAELVGQPLDRIVGRSDQDFYPPDVAVKFEEDDRRIMATHEPMEYESVFERNGRPKRFLHVKKVPLYDRNGQPIGVQVLYWDWSVFRETEEKLKEAQRDLLESSRLAGMAEVATGVLHNIGNALNSVNVSADVARKRIQNMRAPSLVRVAQLLIEQGDRIADFVSNDPRGQKLPEFLVQLSQHFTDECRATSQELDALCVGVEHIKTVVAAQQDFARATDVLEDMAAAEIVEYALRITGASLTRHDISVVRDFRPVPPVRVQRQKALQILVNLINNAKDAIDDAHPAEKRLTIGLRLGASGQVEIAIADNGIGIAPENLTRVFSFGFTTKKKGHGFGLHSSALSAKELGGELHATSEGVGRGATFVLALPVADATERKPESAVPFGAPAN